MKTKTTAATKIERPFGEEIVGHSFESAWYELHQRSKDGNGEWYCTPSYRRIAEKDVPAKLAEFKRLMRATEFTVGGLTLQFVDKEKHVYEVRIIKRQSVCTVMQTCLVETR